MQYGQMGGKHKMYGRKKRTSIFHKSNSSYSTRSLNNDDSDSDNDISMKDPANLETAQERITAASGGGAQDIWEGGSSSRVDQ